MLLLCVLLEKADGSFYAMAIYRAVPWNGVAFGDARAFVFPLRPRPSVVLRGGSFK
jgi:hypothetical protein